MRAELAIHAEVSEGRPRKSNRSLATHARFGHRPGRVCRGLVIQIQWILHETRGEVWPQMVRIGEASHPGPPKLRIIGASQGEVPSTVPASDGALEAMDSDTESVRSVVRSHHSLEGAFEMDLDAVESEVGLAVNDGVSAVSGEVELLSVEEVFEVPELHDSSPQIRSIPVDAVDVVFRSIPHFLRGPFLDAVESPAERRTCRRFELFSSGRLGGVHTLVQFGELSAGSWYRRDVEGTDRSSPKSGIGLAIALLVATFWTDQLAPSIRPVSRGIVILGGHSWNALWRSTTFCSGCPVRLGTVVALCMCPCPSELRSSCCSSGFGHPLRGSSRCRAVEVFVRHCEGR